MYRNIYNCAHCIIVCSTEILEKKTKTNVHQVCMLKLNLLLRKQPYHGIHVAIFFLNYMGTNTNRYWRKLLSEKCKLCFLKVKVAIPMNVTLMKAREAHLFPLFNPVGFNSQQMFIPKTSCYKFPASISVSKCVSRDANCYINLFSYLLLQNLVSHCPQQTALASAKLFCLLPCSSMNSVLVHCFPCL